MRFSIHAIAVVFMGFFPHSMSMQSPNSFMDSVRASQLSIEPHDFAKANAQLAVTLGATADTTTTTNSILFQCAKQTTTKTYDTYCKFFVFDNNGKELGNDKTAKVTGTTATYSSVHKIAFNTTLENTYINFALMDYELIADDTIGYALESLTSASPCRGFSLNDIMNGTSTVWTKNVQGVDGSSGWMESTFPVRNTKCKSMSATGTLEDVGEITVRIFVNYTAPSTSSTDTSTTTTSAQKTIASLQDQWDAISYVYADGSSASNQV